MIPEPCPHCNGKCCRDSDFGGRVYHMGAESYYHWCDYCQDGDKYVPPPTYEQGITEGERRATAAVVAWLRSQGGRSAWTLVEEIEKGAHLWGVNRAG